MELWEIGFGAGILGVFAFFMIALAKLSHDYSSSKRQR